MSVAGTVRFGLRAVWTILFSLLMYLIAAGIRLATCGKPHGFYRPLCKVTSIWGHGIAWGWGMKIQVSGEPPKTPFTLVTNHISYTDVLVLCSVCPGWFVSKLEVASWPGVGALTKMALTLFIDRETRRDVSRMNTLIADLVRAGGSVIFFPEGTTSRGQEILPFKPSLFQPAVELNMPVHIGVIHYSTAKDTSPAAERVAWVDDDEFLPHLKTLLSEKGFTADVDFSAEPVQANDRKTLSGNARESMIEIHTRMIHNLS